ncbi:ABC transporter permease [Aquimarina sp. MMG015]|uniref:ABC transporter permease n=1 Tax=Aquimarina TaxID=290174 RepID=UPI00040EAC6F|nr:MULTISPECIES: ABC transporter permease [Aquimarina]AXT57838.1 ABC transporter permease [Aquimarina sp. AD1]MBQ4803220.1 ABC transporter permease [Aquimarina sp. MMG015]RKN35002.1 ABC transporter permease [Aquimarina sp. AD1]
MFNIERWQEIFDTIAKNKLRTFLTGLSVASGIFILVILLGVGQGMQNGISQEFEGDASNSIWVWTRPTSVEYKGLNPGRFFSMTNEDFDFIHKTNEDVIEYESSRVRIWNSVISYKKESGNYRIEGIFPGFQFIENQSMVSGRFINQQDINEKGKIVAIGNKVKEALFKNDEDPIGKYIKLNDIPFKVVGVYTDKGGEREEEQVSVPSTTAQQVFNRGQNINNLSYTLKPEKDFETAVAKSEEFVAGITTYLKNKHIIAPTDERAIGIGNSLEQAKRFYSLIFMIKAFFWWVGVCTIIAGVVGVSNIMLIIVKERTKEIGIRKAIGAMPSSIIGMILHEAIFVTAIAGFTGLIFGLILLELLGPMIKTDFISSPSVNFNVALTTVFILIFAGAIAGFFPAWRAAKIKPIVALRDE